MRNRLSIDGLTKMGKYTGKDKGILNYVQSKNIRYLAGRPIIPVSFVQHRNPMYLKVKINKYTPEGRELIHRNQSAVSEIALRWIRSHPVVSDRATVEFNDNRISLFIAQLGKCSVTGEELNVLDMHCHHKIPYHLSKDDKYSNLIIVKPEVHILIHATKGDTIQRYMTLLNLNDEQVKRLNKLRLLVRNTSLHY